jgi:hypothetical protein
MIEKVRSTVIRFIRRWDYAEKTRIAAAYRAFPGKKHALAKARVESGFPIGNATSKTGISKNGTVRPACFLAAGLEPPGPLERLKIRM